MPIRAPEAPEGRDPRRYAWEDGETCEYRLGSNVTRHTAHVPTINEGWRFTLT